MNHPWLIYLRAKQYRLFGAAGLLGGAVGAIVSNPFAGTVIRRGLNVYLYTALWSAVFTMMISVALFTAVDYYQRRPLWTLETIRKALIAGAFAGAVGGFTGELLFQQSTPGAFQNYILRPIAWGVVGAIAGWRLSKTIPNLKPTRAFVAGAAGGTLGGYAAVHIWDLIPQENVGRIAGVALLGLALGLAVAVADALFRKAFLEVVWAPNETSSVTLGERPVSIGGGDDHIYVSGLSQGVATVQLTSGRIIYSDRLSGQQLELRNGSKLAIGRVTIIVHGQQEL